jgi:hypothetical protein
MTKPSLGMILGLATWVLGCHEPPRIDTSSEEAAVTSVKEVRESLPQRMRPAFDKAVRTVVLTHYGEDALRETEGGPERFGAHALEPLNGMTAAEVLTEAQRIEAETEEEQDANDGRTRRPPP